MAKYEEVPTVGMAVNFIFIFIGFIVLTALLNFAPEGILRSSLVIVFLILMPTVTMSMIQRMETITGVRFNVIFSTPNLMNFGIGMLLAIPLTFFILSTQVFFTQSASVLPVFAAASTFVETKFGKLLLGFLIGFGETYLLNVLPSAIIYYELCPRFLPRNVAEIVAAVTSGLTAAWMHYWSYGGNYLVMAWAFFAFFAWTLALFIFDSIIPVIISHGFLDAFVFTGDLAETTLFVLPFVFIGLLAMFVAMKKGQKAALGLGVIYG